jgi:TonB-linked SusC/RagA family outer membrane protein
MLESYEYALFRNEAINNDQQSSNYQYLFTEDELWKFQHNRDYTDTEIAAMTGLGEEQKEALRNSPAFYYASHDLFAEQFGGTSPQQQLNVNVSGGSSHFRYYTSVGYFAQDGIFQDAQYAGKDVNSSYNRYNIRSNIDVDVFKNLQMSVQFGGQFEKNRGITGKDGDITTAGSRHKEMMYAILGTPPYSLSGLYDGKLVNSTPLELSPMGIKTSGASNTAYLLNKSMFAYNTANINLAINLKHSMDYLTQGLSASGSFSYNDTYRKGMIEYIPVPNYSMFRNPDNPNEFVFMGGVSSPSSISDNQYNYKRTQIYLEGKINYERTFDRHAITGMLLYNAQRVKDPGLMFNVPEGMLGLAGRITYGFDNRYLAELNLGYNGSENFPPEKRFGFFPAYSLGWIASNESFFPENNWVTWVKFRGSYGEVGSDRVGGRRFLYLPSTWSYTGSDNGNGFRFGNTSGDSDDPAYAGSNESTVGNPNVTWERAKKTNIGIELRFLKNRLSFTGDLFRENRDNILWNLGTVPAIVAATLPPANIGKVSNKGYELVLSWRDQIKDFNYGIGINVSYARNRVEFKDEPANPHEWMNETGFSLSQYRGFRTDGFYNNDAEAFTRPYVSYDGNKVQAGDIRYVDIDGDGAIDNKDRVPIGYSNLPRYSFGGNIDVSYKGFSVAVLFTGSLKGSMRMDSFYVLNPFYMISGAAMQWQYDGRWTPEKAAQGIAPTYPRASMNNFDTQNGQMNDLWLRSSQFVRLKNIEIGYTFGDMGPLKKIGMSAAKIYLTGNNLYTWGHQLIDGYDPEQMDGGGAADGYLYPPMKSYNIGINIQF